MPSSLRRVNSRALEYSSRIPVSVCGTGRLHSNWSAFLGTNFHDVVATVVLTYPIRTGLSLPSIRPRHIVTSGLRNINRMCIDYSLRPRLSSRLTLGGRAFPRNPWAFGGGDSHPSLATHASILARARSTEVHTPTSMQTRRSATPRLLEGAASAVCLAPLHYPRRTTRPVSCYALFQGWLLLSQPPGCLCNPTSFAT